MTVGLGREAYLYACDLLGLPALADPLPAARERHLPPWMRPALWATEAAQARIRAWVAAGSKPVTAEEAVSCRFLGDEPIHRLVTSALFERIAPPAARFLVDEVIFLGTGWWAAGWAYQVAAPPGPRLRLAMVDGSSRDPARVTDLILHEGAHHWLGADVAGGLDNEIGNRREALYLRAARDPDLLRDITADCARDERAADALARAWGGRIDGTDALDIAGIRADVLRLGEWASRKRAQGGAP